MSRRQAKIGDTQANVTIPSDKIGLVVGKKGVTIKKLQSDYDVTINIPSTQGQQPPGSQVVISITGHNPTQAAQDIHQMVYGSASAGSKRGVAFLFRISPQTQELQILVQHKDANGAQWNVPADQLAQPGDEADNFKNGILRILQAGSGAQNPPWSSLHALETLDLPGKTIHHFLVTKEWDAWEPSPVNPIGFSDAPFVVNGQQQASIKAHCWVDVGLCQAESKRGQGGSLHKDVTLWFKHNASIVLPQVQQLYVSAYGENCVRVTQHQAGPQHGGGFGGKMGGGFGAGAAVGNCDCGKPCVNWTNSPAGQSILVNLRAMVKQLGELPDDQLMLVSEKVFNPYHLRTAMTKWAQEGGPLPVVPATIMLQ